MYVVVVVFESFFLFIVEICFQIVENDLTGRKKTPKKVFAFCSVNFVPDFVCMRA